MASIYSITDEFMAFLEFVEEEGLTEEEIADQLEALGMEWNDKADAYGKVIRNIEAGIEARKAEAKRLTDLNKADENKIKTLKHNLLYNMDRAGLKNAGTLFKFTARDSAPKVDIIDESLVPEEFIKIVETKKLDKTALNKAVKEKPEAFEGICKVYRERSLMMK